MPMRIDILSTFPEMFAPASPAALGVSIPGRAIAAGKLHLVATDIRAFSQNKHKKTDDRPYGGGPGMVMTCQPVWDAVMAVEERGAREIADQQSRGAEAPGAMGLDLAAGDLTSPALAPGDSGTPSAGAEGER